MKKLFLIILVSIIILSGCSKIETNNNQKTTNDKLNISTSSYALKLIVEEVGQENVNVSSIYPKGADIHNYELTSRDSKNIVDSDIVFYVSDVEDTVIANLKENDNDDTKYIDISENSLFKDNVPKSFYENVENKKDNTLSSSIIDPHIWITPINDIYISRVIENELIKEDKSNMVEYEKNQNILEEKLLQLDEDYKDFSKIQKNPLIITHDAYSYLNSQYDIEYISLYGAHHEDEPTARDMKNAIDLINKNNIRYVYVEQNDLENKVMNQIIEETGVKKLTLNNIATESLNMNDHQDSIEEILELNLEQMSKGQTNWEHNDND